MANLSRMGEVVMIAASLAGPSCASVDERRPVEIPVKEIIAIEPSSVDVDGEKRPDFGNIFNDAPAEVCSVNGCKYSRTRPDEADFGEKVAPPSTRAEGIPPKVIQNLSARIQAIIKGIINQSK